MIAFIDTEVNPQTKKVADYGAVREDGAVLHSSSKASDGELNKLKTSKYTHLFIRKVESENGITLPFTYVGIGHLDNPRQSQNEERKRTFIFDIHMEEELPDYLQYDFGLTN